jgi:hypothetical protein
MSGAQARRWRSSFALDVVWCTITGPSVNNRQVPAPVPEQPPASAPEALRALWPRVQRFGYSDDAQRESALESASPEELAELVAAIDRSVFQEINNYLDQTDNSEEAIPYGDFAQAAMEAAILLKDGG